MHNFAFLLAQADNGGGGAGGMLVLLVELAIAVLVIAGYWMTFTKAGEPGWASIIPIYNFIVLFRIGGKPWWWVLLLLIPIVNFVVGIIVSIDVAKNFGKGVGFGVGLAFFAVYLLPDSWFRRREIPEDCMMISRGSNKLNRWGAAR